MNHREHVLSLIREERSRQIRMYGSNADLSIGFGGSVTAYPWLSPYCDANSGEIENAFRSDYENYEATHGNPTWMHLIREEVAELFDTRNEHDMITEAIQVASLCVSLCEQLLEGQVSIE